MQPDKESETVNFELKEQDILRNRAIEELQYPNSRAVVYVTQESDLNSFLYPSGAALHNLNFLLAKSSGEEWKKAAVLLKGIPFYTGIDLSTIHLYSKPAGKAALLISIDQPTVNSDSTWEKIAELSEKLGRPVKVIGRASNMLFTEKDVPSIIVQYQYQQVRQKIQFEDGRIISDAAVSLPYLVRQAARGGLDLSFLAGIPGTLGGACLGNAGQTKTSESIGPIIEAVQIFNLETGKSEWLDPKDKKWNGKFFSQRGSVIKQMNLPHTKKVVRRVVLRPEEVGSEKAQDRFKSCMRERFEKNKEAINEKTAGSFWANGKVPRSFLLDKRFIRNLLAETEVVDLNICGARYTAKYHFLSTSKETGDRHVALLMELTRKAFKERWGFVPQREVDIYGSAGSLKDEEFIMQALCGENEPNYQDQ